MTERDNSRSTLETFCRALDAGDSPDLRAAWSTCPGLDQHDLLVRMVEYEVRHRILRCGEVVRVDEYARQFPELTPADLEKLLTRVHEYERRAHEETATKPSDEPTADEELPQLPGYVFQRRLGGGGMGQVWLARQLPLDREVAVKVPYAQALDLATREFLLSEARAAARVRHDNVCPVYEVREHDGQVYIVMELIAGRTFEQWVRAERPTPVQLAEKLAVVARALDDMHNAGYVHCDVKPSNVLVRAADDRPVIVDFGLARRLTGRGVGPGPWAIQGTPAFMAPEQARGDGPHVGPRSDVYALGATLYALLVGRPPFWGGSVKDVLARVQAEPATFPEGAKVHPDLRAVCLKALEKDPDRRYASAGEMADDLLAFAAGRPQLLARPAGRVRRLRHWAKRNRGRLVGAAAVLLAVVAGGLLAHRLVRDRERAGLSDRVRVLLASPAPDDAAKDEIEATLDRLGRLDGDAAGVGWARYVDKLLDRTRLGEGDWERLERAVDGHARTAAGGAALGTPERRERFERLAVPYAHSGSVYFFIRPDGDRAEQLDRVIRIGARLAAGSELYLARTELLKMRLARGELGHARDVAVGLLDGADLTPAWRMEVLRDYAWVAIQSGDPAVRDDALRRVEEALADGSRRREYLGLMVERARLLAAGGDPDGAERVLGEYFKAVGEPSETMDLIRPTTAPGAGPRTNLAAQFYLDGRLLHGFLLEARGKPAEALAVWRAAFKAVQRTRVAAYYEGAVLGSLAGEIGTLDAIGMVTYTLEGAGAHGESPAMKVLHEWAVPGIGTIATGVRVISEILNDAWRDGRGKEFARQVAFREIEYGEYTNVQIRLWLYQGLRRAITGESGRLSEAQEALVWRLIEDSVVAYKAGRFKEELFVEVVRVGLDPKGAAGWPGAAAGLPPEVRGPIAYVLGRHYATNRGRPADAATFYDDALRHAGDAPLGPSLRSLVEAELKAPRR